MLLTFHPRFGEITVSGSAADYASLAAVIRQGAGTLAAGPTAGESDGSLYFDGHVYLGEGSAPVTLASPHGGMPSGSSA